MANRRSFLKTSALALPGLTVFGRSQAAPPKGLPLYSSTNTEDYWKAISQLYALSDSRIYMNTGGLGPVSFPVLERFRGLTTDLQTMSETGHRYIEEARSPVASFMGAKPEEIAFTRNATEGNATIASGMNLKQGDEIILDASAHPGGAIPWLNQLRARGVIIRTFEPSAEKANIVLERIEALLSPRTKVIQVRHITAPTGVLLPVKQIADLAHSKGCWFHIDGAQSLGMLPIDLHHIGCDSYASSGHKWLGAVHGTGVLFIREERLDEILPTEVGAYSDAGYQLPNHFEYVPTARRHESGTRNAPLVDSVRVACSFMNDIGLQRIRDRGLHLTSLLRHRLESISGMEILTPATDEMRSSMLTFRSASMPFSELNQKLSSRHKLRLRIVTEQDLNAIRVSLHVFNTEDHVERVVEGIKDVLSNG